MKNVINFTKERFEFRVFVTKTYAPLIQMKQEDNQIDFNELMKKVLPEIKLYLTRQLRIAVKFDALPEGKYKVEDFVDELYIEAFESIHEAKEDIYLYLWLFKKADEILDDIIVDEDFDNTFFKNIENYTKVEWEAMEEKISRDADGDLVMLEEFDDRSYLKFDYTLNNVFIEDNELEFIKNLNEQLSQKEIQHQIDVILHLLPMSMRTIFELTINQQFDSEEIAAIKDISISEVEKVLANAKSTILSRLVSKNLPQ